MEAFKRARLVPSPPTPRPGKASSPLPWDGETEAQRREAAEPGCARPGARTARPPSPRLPMPSLWLYPHSLPPWVLDVSQAQGMQVGLWRPGLQAVSWSSCGFRGITAASVGPGLVAGATWPLEASGLCVLCLVRPAWSSVWALWEVAASGCSKPASVSSLPLPLSLCPLLPLPKCLPQKSTRKCRWKTLMLTATPPSWRTSHPHPSGCHLLLPSPTPSQSRDQPRGPAGHLSCFSWAFRSTVPPAHSADEETEAREGKQLARGHSASWGSNRDCALPCWFS